MNRFNLTEWAIRHRSLVTYFMLVIVVAGVWSYFRLGRSEDPDFTVKTMVVQVGWPGATVSDTLQQITDRLERKLQETPNLDYLKSYTTAGQATVFVNLKDSTPAAQVPDIWYQVRKKVGDIRNDAAARHRRPRLQRRVRRHLRHRLRLHRRWVHPSGAEGHCGRGPQAAPRAAGHLQDRRPRGPGRARLCGVLDRAARGPRDRPRRADRRPQGPERRHASGRGADRETKKFSSASRARSGPSRTSWRSTSSPTAG